LSLFLFILAGLNVLFLISWLLHSIQARSLNDSPQVAVYRSSDLPREQRQLKVEVFNACGVKDVAKQMTDFLRKNDVDVVYFGNYLVNNKIYSIQNTLIIDRQSGDLQHAKRVARLVGVEARYVINQISPEREVDVTILIGNDYKILNGLKLAN